MRKTVIKFIPSVAVFLFWVGYQMTGIVIPWLGYLLITLAVLLLLIPAGSWIRGRNRNDKRIFLIKMPTNKIPGFPSVRVYGQRVRQITTLPASATIRANYHLIFGFSLGGVVLSNFSVSYLETGGQILAPLENHLDSQSYVVTFEIPYSFPQREYVMQGVHILPNSDTVTWRQEFKI